jgi:hypothetical protein
MSNEFSGLNRQTKFMESHVGGDLNDTNTQFTSQKDIIKSNNNLYTDLLNDSNDLSRNRDVSNAQSSEYTQELRKEYYSKDTRINNYPTIINDDVNISNPIIYPKEYDAYFEYLSKKGIKSINTQVIQKKTYVNIDSANRNKLSTMRVDSYIQLSTNPLVFVNGTNSLKIKLPDADKQFQVGEQITLQGFNFYSISYKFVNFYFESGTNKVTMDLIPNYTTSIPYYNVLIEISNVVSGASGSDNYFKNIPLNVINNVHTVQLINTDSNETKFTFNIPINFYADNSTSNVLSSGCTIKYYFLGNYPINYINSGVPISLFNLNPYLLIDSVDSQFLTVKLTNTLSLINSPSIQISGNWINSSTFETGGSSIQIGKILNIDYAYLNPSNYKITLGKRIDNVVCIKIKSSEIPNTSKLIYSNTNVNNVSISNNMFYWENALDEPTNIYSIAVPVGNYTSSQLENIMEKLISQTPRIIKNTNIVPFNNIKISIDQSNNITTLTSYNKYKLPNCITSLESVPDILAWILTIQHPSHNQKLGSKIQIMNSTNYKNISAHHINTSHIITKILGNDCYQITLYNINLLDNFTQGSGGNEIIIMTLNPFKIYFSQPNTMGNILGFKAIGEIGSITPYSSPDNNYTIDNSQLYIYGTENILIVNNYNELVQSSNDFNFNVGRYILLVSNVQSLNQCINPNNISYFYKFQLSNNTGSYIFNSFVDNPIYFNPPIKYIEAFDFKFVSETGEEFNFYSIDNSMTFEITSIINHPENTNLSTYVARV